MNYMQNVFSMCIEALETSMAFLKIQWFSFLAPKGTLRKKEKQYGFSLNMNCIWVYFLFDEVQSRGKLRMFWWNSHFKIFHFHKHVYATVLLKIIQANFIEVYGYLYDALYKHSRWYSKSSKQWLSACESWPLFQTSVSKIYLHYVSER